MGIRFACHVCEKRLNIKYELAGRRGVCPSCSTKFRIPLEDAEHSLPIDVKQVAVADISSSTNAVKQTRSTTATASSGSAVSAVPSIPSVSLLEEDPQVAWYVRPPSGGQYGPASGEILKQWIGEGRVAANALLWREGWPHWRDAVDVLPELANRLPLSDAAPRPKPREPQLDVQRAVPTPEYSGQPGIGSDRRARSMRRVVLIGLLSAVAVTLVGVLIVVINQ
jgi:GYF domain 2